MDLHVTRGSSSRAAEPEPVAAPEAAAAPDAPDALEAEVRAQIARARAQWTVKHHTMFPDAPPPIKETPRSERAAWRLANQAAKTRRGLIAEKNLRRLGHGYQSRMRRAAVAEAAPSQFPPCPADASPDAAAPAPAPAKPSAGVALLRREMVAVKGQPQLMAALEQLVKASEKQKRRREAAGGAQQPASAPKKPNLNMVFGGPPGTGKTSSVKKIAKVLAAPEVGVLKRAEVVELNKETQLPTGHTVPERVGKIFESAKGCILFLDEAHKRTDSRAFVDALLPLLSKHEGEVMVVIAGYKDEIMTWLRNSDKGNPNRNPNPLTLILTP